jgi:uncharacterized protein (DUF736 family)
MANESIGALWIKESEKGEYMSGVVEVNGEKHPIVVFKNTYKEKENQPDYRILPKKKTGEAKPSEDFKDDIPF